jgi:hypothetical protein
METSDHYEMSASVRTALWIGAVFVGPVAWTYSVAFTAYGLIASQPAVLFVTGPAIILTSTITWASMKMRMATVKRVRVFDDGLELTPLVGKTVMVPWRDIEAIEGYVVDFQEGPIRGLRIFSGDQQPFIVTSRIRRFLDLLWLVLSHVGDRRQPWSPSAWERMMNHTYTRRQVAKSSERFWAEIGP